MSDDKPTRRELIEQGVSVELIGVLEAAGKVAQQ